MKKIKYIFMMLFLATACLQMTSCSNSTDEPDADIATKISGNYVGELTNIGYSEGERCYVTITRKAKDAVGIEISCEELDVNTNPVNLIITERKDGTIQLKSESGYAIEGNISGKTLSISFSMGYYDYSFFGQKD